MTGRGRTRGASGCRGRVLEAALAAAVGFLFTSAFLAAPGPGPLPKDLQAVFRSSMQRLCALYAVPPQRCSEPIHIRVQALPDPLPAAWRGFPTYAAGAAQPPRSRILIILSRCGPYPFGDPEQTLRHELSHVLLYRSLGYEPPRWLDEGLAMRAGDSWSFSDDLYATLAMHSVARGTWPLSRVEQDFGEGESSVRRSYALAKGFVRSLFPNDESVTAFVLEARRDGSVRTAFLRRFGATPGEAFRRWAVKKPWWGGLLVWLSSPTVLWIAVTALFLLAVAAGIRRRRIKYEQLPD